MVRWLAAAALLVLPYSASADEGDGSVPLRSLCSSPTMDYCVSFWTWDYVTIPAVDGDGQPIPNVGRLSIESEFFGSGIASSTGFLSMSVLSAGCVSGGFTVTTFWSGVGRAVASDMPGCVSGVGGAWVDTYTLSFVDRTEVGAPPKVFTCTAGVDCYDVSVPEPSSLLLLAAGLGGVVIAGRRRVRDRPATAR